jgi:hypothetical protein
MLDLKLRSLACTALTLGGFVFIFSLMVKFTLIFLVSCILLILGMLVYAIYLSYFFYFSDHLSKDSTENASMVESENDSVSSPE